MDKMYFDLYSEIEKKSPSGAREYFRDLAISGLALMDKLKGVDSYLKKPRVQFIYIHHVFKDEEVQLHTLLKELQKMHTFISYSEAVDRVLTNRIDKPYIAISSDDGFKNNLRTAEILNEYDAKACFFVNPSIVGETDYGRIEQYCKTQLQFPPVEFLNWKDIDTLQKYGHEIGSHTMNHMNIARASASEIKEDMTLSYETLTDKCGAVKHFAFPFGRFFHFSEEGRKACFEAGFLSCATAERGCHVSSEKRPATDELCILRDHVLLNWKIDHIFYFLVRSSKSAQPQNNFFPYQRSN
ncbi:MAG: putative polysaccharide deacetylase [Cytophagaceae bacterium]|jgi:peptidoglycan/xylan/chitin deacetylase (PgdA/CDA1 family)|nr:putative polysaccharide deacetylase [Cytophagaceae bacterium]